MSNYKWYQLAAGVEGKLWSSALVSDHSILGKEYNVGSASQGQFHSTELLPGRRTTARGKFEVWFNHTKEIPQKWDVLELRNKLKIFIENLQETSLEVVYALKDTNTSAFL